MDTIAFFLSQQMSYESHNQILQQEALCDSEKKRASQWKCPRPSEVWNTVF